MFDVWILGPDQHYRFIYPYHSNQIIIHVNDHHRFVPFAILLCSLTFCLYLAHFGREPKRLYFALRRKVCPFSEKCNTGAGLFTQPTEDEKEWTKSKREMAGGWGEYHKWFKCRRPKRTKECGWNVARSLHHTSPLRVFRCLCCGGPFNIVLYLLNCSIRLLANEFSLVVRYSFEREFPSNVN